MSHEVQARCAPEGWCIMMRVLGMLKRLPFVPAACAGMQNIGAHPLAVHKLACMPQRAHQQQRGCAGTQSDCDGADVRLHGIHCV